jgi:hypothetical protein
MTNTKIVKETIHPKGAPITVDAVKIRDQTYVITGRSVKTASLKNEWQADVERPDEVITALKQSPIRIDLLKFWQRIPETAVKYPYYKEWRNVAAIPIIDYKHWWDKQVNPNTRRLIRKSEKLGVGIREVPLNDQLVLGILSIFNECPIRRGKPFRHYGKDFETVKSEMSTDIADSIFIAAAYKNELIGFIKLVLTDNYAMVTMILDKQSHRDRSPVNGLVAKAVQICAERRIPFLTYTLWRTGGHGYFQERNGFEKISVPEYYVPLTVRGKLFLGLKMHKGLKGILPEQMMIWLLALRSKWYARKFADRLPPRTAISPQKQPESLSPS